MNDVDGNTEDREIVIARVFNAPRDIVFKAFTDRDDVDQ